MSDTGSDLTKVTVNLTPRAVKAVNQIVGRTGDTQTDSINRALVGCAKILHLVEAGGGQLDIEQPDGTTRTIRIVP